MKTNELDERDASLLTGKQETNAQKWAQSFNYHLAIRGEQPLDEGLMIGWFANAIETAKDETITKLQAQLKREMDIVDLVLSLHDSDRRVSIDKYENLVKRAKEVQKARGV